MENSCVHIYYGDGKGKTTAAVGLIARARGHEVPCCAAFFLKNGESGEVAALETLGCTVLFDPQAAGFLWQMDEDEKLSFLASQGALLAKARSYIDTHPEGGVLVLDEVIDALAAGAFDEAELLRLLEGRGGFEVVLTGHSCPAALAARADYVTHFAAAKHPYGERGLTARRGIEW